MRIYRKFQLFVSFFPICTSIKWNGLEVKLPLLPKVQLAPDSRNSMSVSATDALSIPFEKINYSQ